MNKSVKIGGRRLELRASADTPRLYRCIFGRDIFADTEQILSRNDMRADLYAARMAYVMAKQAGTNSEAALLKAAETIHKPQSLPKAVKLEIAELWARNLAMSIRVPKSEDTEDEEYKLTTSGFMRCCLAAGIRISELDLLTVGMAVDIFREMRSGYDEPKAKNAEQSDFDSF